MTTRWYCEECHRVCEDDDVLRAPDPFTTDGTLQACPQCRCAESLVVACDVNGCPSQASCGTIAALATPNQEPTP